MKKCDFCGKKKKRNKLKYAVIHYEIISENEIIKKSGFLCKKCIKKLRFEYYPF